MRCFICNFVRWRRSRGWLRLPMPAKGLASRIHPVLRPAIFFCCDARSCTRSFGRSNRYSFNSFLAYFHLNSYFLNKSFVGIYRHTYVHTYIFTVLASVLQFRIGTNDGVHGNFSFSASNEAEKIYTKANVKFESLKRNGREMKKEAATNV